MSYKEFYDNIDRENRYAVGLNAHEHLLYSRLSTFINENNLNGKKALEVGSGNGRFQDIVMNYTGIDISERLRKFYHKPFFVVEDGEKYPFESESFDFVFTNAVHEHIPNINSALQEMIRVTKKGGYILFKPAWQCRPWAANVYQVRPYSDFNFFGKLYKALIPIRENLLFRLSYVMPVRLFYCILFTINQKAFKHALIYRKLRANYNKFWQSDSDACNSIDPFMAILFFRANGFDVINYPGMIDQLLVRSKEIVLLKSQPLLQNLVF